MRPDRAAISEGLSRVLADMMSGLVDGGIILSRVLKDKDILPKQVMLYRDFVRAVFLGTGEDRA